MGCERTFISLHRIYNHPAYLYRPYGPLCSTNPVQIGFLSVLFLFSLHSKLQSYLFSFLSVLRTCTLKVRSSHVWRKLWYEKQSSRTRLTKSATTARRPSCAWPSSRPTTFTWTATSTFPAGMTERDSVKTYTLSFSKVIHTAASFH